MINLKSEQYEQQELLQTSYDRELKLIEEERKFFERGQNAKQKGNFKLYETYNAKSLKYREELNNLRKENENVSKTSHKSIYSGENFRTNLTKIFGKE